MTASIQPSAEPTIIYPDSDGQPMADNTKQFRCITTIQGGLDALFKNNTDIFVAGDLLWYPVEGDNKTRLAPDVMVVFGRPKGDRVLINNGEKIISLLKLFLRYFLQEIALGRCSKN